MPKLVLLSIKIRDSLSVSITYSLSLIGHKCYFPGCGNVLVIDGNMKNRRQVCYAKDAGFIEFKGLPGSIITGCTATPTFKSNYCLHHPNSACALLHNEVDDEELGTTTGPTLRSHLKKQDSGDPVAEKILAKRTTRRQTFYQVLLNIHSCSLINDSLDCQCPT